MKSCAVLAIILLIATSLSYNHALIHRPTTLHMKIESASFGMGCFWKPQELFDNTKGVKRTLVGYTGGTNQKPTYRSVCNGDGEK